MTSPDPSPKPLKHSGPGIASFIVGACAYILAITSVLVFGQMNGRLLLGPFCSCGVPTGFAAIVLGIISVCLPNRKKFFAYLGLALGVSNLVINAIFIALGWVD